MSIASRLTNHTPDLQHSQSKRTPTTHELSLSCADMALRFQTPMWTALSQYEVENSLLPRRWRNQQLMFAFVAVLDIGSIRHGSLC